MKAQEPRRLFGTDGIRGVANVDPMTSEIALSLGRALAYLFQNGHRHRRILIGKDTRLSGYMLETALASGITSMGADVLLVGPMPTPAVAFLTSGMRASAGVMISASHNTYQDNGIKIFDHNGFKLADEKERELESLIFSDRLEKSRPAPDKIGKAFRVEEAKGRYIEFLKGTFPRERTLEGVRLVLDCANGAAYEIGPTVFEELGAEVIPLNVKPNGLNINAQAGAVFPEKVSQKVLETGAHLGIALDGDADRVIFVDEQGRVVDGDAILAIVGEDLLKKGELKNKTVVGTVMSNIGLDDYLRKRGGSLVRTQVGDRYLVERMRKQGYLFGGEPSGHLVFLNASTTGDGMVGALRVLALMGEQAKTLSELIVDYQPFPQVLKNVPVKKRVALEGIPTLEKKIRDTKAELGDSGRLLVRYSGTEPLVRVMVEGRDAQQIEGMAQEIAACIAQNLA